MALRVVFRGAHKIKKGINESDIINGDRLNKNRKKIDNIIYFNDFIIIYR